MKGVHNHVESNEDVENELYELFLEARDSYSSEVKGRQVRLDYFIELFLSSHYYIDCEYAKCKNAHRRNLTLIRQLFTDSFHLVKPLFVKPSLTQAELSALVNSHLTSAVYSKKRAAYSLGCSFTDKQIEHMVSISEEYHIFKTMDGSSLQDALRSLFGCQNGFRLQVCHIRKAVVFFDELLECNLIGRNWQTVLDRCGLLVSVRSGKLIKRTSLSSSLSKARASVAAKYQSIRKAVFEMKKEELYESR